MQEGQVVASGAWGALVRIKVACSGIQLIVIFAVFAVIVADIIVSVVMRIDRSDERPGGG